MDIFDRKHHRRHPRQRVEKLFQTQLRLLAFVARLTVFADDKMRQKCYQIRIADFVTRKRPFYLVLRDRRIVRLNVQELAQRRPDCRK